MKQKQNCCTGAGLILFLVFSLFLIGVMVSMHSVPDHDPANANLKALYQFSSEQVKQWTAAARPAVHFDVEYTAPSWTPISITGLSSSDPTIELCKLDFKEYAKNPQLYAMFKDLVGKSACGGSNKRTARLSELKAEMENKPSDWTYLKPNGFVFHESRVGSTLVANMLASDPYSMVFSESAPPSAIMLSSLPRERKIELFRDVITLMGLTTMHKRMFFKFQSITNTVNTIALDAFPDTPWVFVYRQPVQTMMSHVGKGGSGAPCLRSKRNPSKQVSDAIAKFEKEGHTANNAAYCAAHLNMLCTKAIEAMQSHGEFKGTGTERDGTQRGIVVDYAGLPGAIPRVMLPLFGVAEANPQWVSKMEECSQFYSKGGRKKSNEVFSGDSEEKDAKADAEVKEAATSILLPTYNALTGIATGSIFAMKQSLIGGDLSQAAREDADAMWAELADLPIVKGGTGALQGVAQAPHVPAEGFDTLKGLSAEMDLLWRSFASNHSSKPFEHVPCPDFPDPDYPREYPIMDIISNWGPDNTDIPPMHYDSICHFDYQTQRDIAERYRDAEKPFVVYNVPAVDRLVKKWSNVDYINKRLGGQSFQAESSTSNHFMYFKNQKGKVVTAYNGSKVAWEPPTKPVKITFEDWLKVAVAGQAQEDNQQRQHIYFRVTAQAASSRNGWIFEETEIFKPKKSFFMVKPAEQRGIHCRFGMRSIIAENHYDGSRNFVIEVGGLRRWILSHPKNCESMYLLQKGHPSGRHSEVDWSNPDLNIYPKFKNLVANEIIFKPGEVLYVPTSWFHYIVSLNVNWQCNSRSGRDMTYTHDLKKCGWQ